MGTSDLHTTVRHRQREGDASQPRRRRWIALTSSALALLLVVTGCNGEQSMFEPSGTGAQSVDRLWWLMLWMGTGIYVLVLVILGIALFSGSRSEPDSSSDSGSSPEPEVNRGLGRRARQRLVLLGGIVMPLAVLAIVYAATLTSINELLGMEDEDALQIDVIGHQYWWEVHYPDHGITTANEIHIPVDQPVDFNLTSSDVIHSFWVPQLYGTIDMMPGTTTNITIEAVEAGTYRGQCNQFCGLQHANMAFYVNAQEEDEFAEWAEQQAQPAEEPTSELLQRGEEIYLSSACVYCHTIDGTASQGTLGPDLTHLASRDTLAAGTLENNTGNLASWILDPQQLKPGAEMPGATISGEDLQDLLAYLNSLD